MSQFKSHRVYSSSSVKVAGGGTSSGNNNGGGRSVSQVQDQGSNMNNSSPSYLRQLPTYKVPYLHVIEMYNKKTCKRRIIALESSSLADEFVNLLNLVNSFLNYEAMLVKDNQQNESAGNTMLTQGNNNNNMSFNGKDVNQSWANQRKRSAGGGPLFITNWVKTYLHHQGQMELSEEYYEVQNFPYTLAFGRETDAVKGLTFGKSFGLLVGMESERRMQALANMLQTFNRETVTSIAFRDVYMSDYVLKQFIPALAQYQQLTTLELSRNQLTNASLSALSVIFSNCPQLTKVDLSNNLLGFGDKQAQILDQFLLQLLTELDSPQWLDLSQNKFTDESVRPFVMYVFANEDCRLTYFSLEGNMLFSNFAKRTLLKAYSLSPCKASILFKCGPLPFTESTLKHAFNVMQNLANVSQIENQQQQSPSPVKRQRTKSPEQKQVAHSTSFVQTFQGSERYELVVTRRPNYTGLGLRDLPINKGQRDKLQQMLAKLEQAVSNRFGLAIEDLRDLVQEVSALEFEFPRHKLEPIFDSINEKLHLAIEYEHIYCVEVLLECLRLMCARNLRAEDKYAELTLVAQGVARDLVKVLNMDPRLEDNELNEMLDHALDEAKRIGMRGEIIDVAVTLKMMRNNLLQEMQNRTGNSDDEDADPQFLFFGANGNIDDDKITNVYDDKYDQYIEMAAEDLGLTSEVEKFLGYHPYSTDYLYLSQMNINYVRKNIKEAKKFLSDEECYAFRNIFDRCYVLLGDQATNESSSLNVGGTGPNAVVSNSKSFQFAKNDQNLKMTRLIFRYRYNLDELFEFKQEPIYPSQLPSLLGQALSVMLSLKGGKNGLNGSVSPLNVAGNAVAISDDLLIYQYKNMSGKDQIEFNGTKISRSITNKVEKGKANVPVIFNKNLFNLCESDYNLQDSSGRAIFACRVQELIESFVLKHGRLIHEDLADEYYLQIFRQMNRKNKQSSEKSAKSISNSLYMMVVLSRYVTPTKDLMEGFEQWLHALKESMENDFNRLVLMILQNFQTPKKPQLTNNQQLDTSHSSNSKPTIDWAPSIAEMESLITGEPLVIQVYTPVGEIFQYAVDESTTVESLLTSHVWKEKFFLKEPDSELYWLFKLVDKFDNFDEPLTKDKKILKILYKTEKQQSKRTESANSDASGNSFTRSSIFGMNTADDSSNSRLNNLKPQKFLRKATIASKMESMQENWVDPQLCSTVFMVKKRIFSSLHIDKNVKTLPKKALNYLFHQVRMDYIDKNLLKRLSNYEDVSLFAALIIKIKYWGKILRSKDNSLSKELLIKNIEYAVPTTFLRDKPQEYWITKIQKDFERNNLRELSIEEAQEKFLNLFSQYQLAYSSYYVMRATCPNPHDLKGGHSSDEIHKPNQLRNLILESDGGDLDEEGGASDTGHGKFNINRDTFLANHMNHDLLCVINWNGVSFYENSKRDKVIQRIPFEELLYAMGSKQVLKLGYIGRNQSKILDAKIELYTTNGQSARAIGEDIVAYCQLKLAENTKNDQIEVVKRNITNLFEDVEDPFADDFMENYQPSNGTPNSPPVNKNGKLQTSSKLNQQSPPQPGKKRGEFDYFLDDGSQSITPTNMDMHGHSVLAKQAYIKHQAQIKGYQFRFKEKAFLSYLRKYPLYVQRSQILEQREQQNTTATMGSSFQSNSKGSQDASTKKNPPGKIKHAFGGNGNRIEEDKDEDEDDSQSSKQIIDLKNGSSKSRGGNLPSSSQSSAKEQFKKNLAPQLSQSSNNNSKPLQKSQSPFNKNSFKDVSPASQGSNRSSHDNVLNVNNPSSSSNKSNIAAFNFNSASNMPSNSVKKAETSPLGSSPPPSQSYLTNPLSIPDLDTPGFKPPPAMNLNDSGITSQGGFTDKNNSSPVQLPQDSMISAPVSSAPANYDQMTKVQTQENLNNLLSKALGSFPLPPPPMKK